MGEKVKKKIRPFVTKYWILGIPVVIVCGLLYFFILKDLPSPTQLTAKNIPQATQIFDRHGKLLYTIHGEKNQSLVPLTNISTHLQNATIAIEDRDFFHHGAIDLRGIFRAFFAITLHHQIQGGSTLTQQLVKNSLLTSERTITRKLKEVILSFATELIYPKEKILEMYLNQIPYGGTSWGIEAAAQTHFGKHAKDLDIAQSALLAGLPEAPTTFSPFGAHPELAKKRQLTVLQAMYNEGYITKKQQETAAQEPLIYQKNSAPIFAPHFSLYIKELLINKYGEKTVEGEGLRVITSLDLSLQETVQASVAAEISDLKGSHVSNGAALVTKPATGEILAMVGSKDYFDTDIDGYVNIVLRPRQPGSSIKPINYATGLIKGFPASTAFIDQPTCFPPNDLKGYCPKNYDLKWHGVMQMREALGNSINIPAVKMLKLNGIQAMLATASAMGITTFNKSEDEYGLALTLGAGETTMLDMTTAYGVFANGGYRVDMHPILKVTDHTGKILEEYIPFSSPIFGKKVLPAGVAYIISDILADNNARLLEFGPTSALHIDKHIVSAKTGTTNDFHDNWTFGYTPSFVVGTWVGNNDNSPMSGLISGITGAAPIWHDIMEYLLHDKAPEPMQRPDDIVQKRVCQTTGIVVQTEGGDSCPTKLEYFMKGTEFKKTAEVIKENAFIDKSTNNLAKPGQTDNVEQKEVQFLIDLTGDKYCLSCPHPTPTP